MEDEAKGQMVNLMISDHRHSSSIDVLWPIMGRMHQVSGLTLITWYLKQLRVGRYCYISHGDSLRWLITENNKTALTALDPFLAVVVLVAGVSTLALPFSTSPSREIR